MHALRSLDFIQNCSPILMKILCYRKDDAIIMMRIIFDDRKKSAAKTPSLKCNSAQERLVLKIKTRSNKLVNKNRKRSKHQFAHL